MRNLLADIPDDLPAELFEALVDSDTVRIERIVSRGHATPPGAWYDQDRHEWVLLLRGAARLAFADGREVGLAPGDWLEIPAHARHRVAWTDPDQDTVWLAVHFAYPSLAVRRRFAHDVDCMSTVCSQHRARANASTRTATWVLEGAIDAESLAAIQRAAARIVDAFDPSRHSSVLAGTSSGRWISSSVLTSPRATSSTATSTSTSCSSCVPCRAGRVTLRRLRACIFAAPLLTPVAA